MQRLNEHEDSEFDVSPLHLPKPTTLHLHSSSLLPVYKITLHKILQEDEEVHKTGEGQHFILEHICTNS